MYAIIETGGKQYRVKKDDVIDVELLDIGDNLVEFKNVLLVHEAGNIKIGTPYLADTVVQAELIKQDVKGPKVVAFKYKRRKPIRRKVGHRQRYTRIKIKDIIG
ncbi:MAG: 50S ribosomal protein L21 [Chlamydiales bacterium]|jgi:large subunit ribosomal protein L21|nr:50S ribosomal protein L21 [Chlamydiales bacterium]